MRHGGSPSVSSYNEQTVGEDLCVLPVFQDKGDSSYMKNIRAKLEVLSQSEMEAIHSSTLKILETVGFRIPNEECMDLCEKLGAIVDRTAETVRVPREAMEQVLAEVKKAGTPVAPEEKVQRLKGNISTQIFINDYKTQTRRYGQMDDVLRGIVVSDSLLNIGASNAIVVPHDVPYNMSDVLSFQAIYTYSTKPGGTYILSPTSGKYIIQMGEVIGRRVGYFLETVSPLQFRKESLEMALVFAKCGMPVSLGPMVIGGATGPVTLAGTVALQNAEILSSMFMIKALEGMCAFYGSYNHTMDLRTTICSFGSPNQALLGMAAGQMARSYGIQAASNSGLTDAIMPDFQAGFEKSANAIFSLLAGTTDIGAQGIVGADQGISLEQLVLDNEWMDAYNYILQGIEVVEDTIAAEVIASVGIGGNYISEEHTVEYMRSNYWPSNIFNRNSWDACMQGGLKTALDKAYEYVQSVTADYKQREPILPASQVEQINYLVRQADEELARERE